MLADGKKQKKKRAKARQKERDRSRDRGGAGEGAAARALMERGRGGAGGRGRENGLADDFPLDNDDGVFSGGPSSNERGHGVGGGKGVGGKGMAVAGGKEGKPSGFSVGKEGSLVGKEGSRLIAAAAGGVMVGLVLVLGAQFMVGGGVGGDGHAAQGTGARLYTQVRVLGEFCMGG